MAANNVLAHVPDLHDFVGGFAVLLQPAGVATFEFPHLLRQMQENQFDTIYHEHFSYLSLHVVTPGAGASTGCGCSTSTHLSTHGGIAARVRLPRGGVPRIQSSRPWPAALAEEAGGRARETQTAYRDPSRTRWSR